MAFAKISIAVMPRSRKYLPEHDKSKEISWIALLWPSNHPVVYCYQCRGGDIHRLVGISAGGREGVRILSTTVPVWSIVFEHHTESLNCDDWVLYLLFAFFFIPVKCLDEFRFLYRSSKIKMEHHKTVHLTTTKVLGWDRLLKNWFIVSITISALPLHRFSGWYK